MRTVRALAVWPAAALVVWSLSAGAQEADRKADKADAVKVQRRGGDEDLRGRVKELLEKQRQGQPLAPEEREMLVKFQGLMERGDRPPGPEGPPREENPFADLGGFNVVDEALYGVAKIFCEKEEYGSAVKELARVAAESPDERAKAGAHLVAGHIYRLKIGDTEKAIEEYKQVTGDLAYRATKAIVKCYEEIGEPEKAAQVIEEQLKRAEKPIEKAMMLNEIAGIYRRSGDLDKAIETLRRIPQAITYDEAEAIRKDTTTQHGFFALADKMRQKIGELHAAGRHEEAERIERGLRELEERNLGPMRRDDGGERPIPKRDMERP